MEMNDYGSLKYWDYRYARNKEIFEWYLDYEAMYDYLDEFVPIEARILEIGCGTSSILWIY